MQAIKQKKELVNVKALFTQNRSKGDFESPWTVFNGSEENLNSSIGKGFIFRQYNQRFIFICEDLKKIVVAQYPELNGNKLSWCLGHYFNGINEAVMYFNSAIKREV